MGQPLRVLVSQLLQKSNTNLLYDPEISLLGGPRLKAPLTSVDAVARGAAAFQAVP